MKISILCPSFNHERYVGYFIESVLNQTFEDFELIIVDDCSSDKNVEKIQVFKDERIKLIQHAYNKGINAALNTAFENSSGEILLFCASDDMLESNALEKINEAFSNNQNIDVVYPSAKIIDTNNCIYDKKIQETRNNIELLHYLFFNGNCLYSVGMCIKKENYKKNLYPLPISMCNHQDTFMHIKLLIANSNILFLQDELIKYRHIENHNSISSSSSVTNARENLEIEHLMDAFLSIEDVSLLQEIFSNEIKQTNIIPYKNAIKFFLGRMALLSPFLARKYWGYHKIMEFYNDNNASILKNNYNFTFKDLLQLAKLCENDIFIKKYKKYKKLFNQSITLLCTLLVTFIIYILVG